MRVQSNTPSKGKSGGWLHIMKDDYQKKTHEFVIKLREITKEIPVDCESMFNRWMKETEPAQLMAFCDSIGVDAMALHMIGCAWAEEHQAWALPMRDITGKITGIRLRGVDGSKWSVKGSKAGLFFPMKYDPRAPLIITEGPTDCAAALTLGFSAIGRQSCMGQHEIINDYIALNNLREVIIISDKDEAKIRPDGTKFYAGQEGSKKLQDSLRVKSLLLILPCKDLREFISVGGDKQMLQGFMRSRVWKNP